MEFRYVLAVLILDICHVVKVSGDSTLIDVEFCKYSQTTRKAVETCPSDERSWKEAASKMNCSDHAENCAGKMAYHCLINPWQNLTVEVCAPETRIRAGFCAEYNRRGGKIQEFYSKTCKGCTQNYQSTEAYKYQECYEKVYQFTQQQKQPQTKQSNQSKITSIFQELLSVAREEYSYLL
ncbi:uncharacterized protein LOC125674989 isoform X2 [Ostrea edulis]|uniref:uncharacterized protein LOC125674989 isoform X2 n=1 Tax=Ostrea edulis TaxID=37623 RepID=UPI0024AF1A71|nr:uncharacterized protein LOC125674989 isoform X2 [Ostrea edulis]